MWGRPPSAVRSSEARQPPELQQPSQLLTRSSAPAREAQTMIPRHFAIAIAVLVLAVLGLSLYAWHMRTVAVSTPVASTDTRPLAPPVAGPTERVTLFVAHDDNGSLRAEAATIPLPSGRQQRAEELLRALLS